MRKITPLYLLHFHQMAIFDQLRIEEALLRTDNRNWCLINSGSPPAIVMGISNQWDLIDEAVYHQRPIPIVRRFSGGGTVFVDEATHFITLICNVKCSETPCFPKEIAQWMYARLKPVFKELDFQLKENDFVHGNHKFGGNAQYLCKQRWLHHCSLLWDYRPENMDYLLLPIKRPIYRESRSHTEFLCKLKDNLSRRELITERLVKELSTVFTLYESSLNDVNILLSKPHRKATQLVR